MLGQDDAAIDLLMGHIRSSGGTSPLPYLKLLEIYRRQGDRESYERTRERFNHRFNAYAPDWDSDLQHGRSLDEYPGVMQRLQATLVESAGHDGRTRGLDVPPRRRRAVRAAGLPRGAVPVFDGARPARPPGRPAHRDRRAAAARQGPGVRADHGAAAPVHHAHRPGRTEPRQRAADRTAARFAGGARVATTRRASTARSTSTSPSRCRWTTTRRCSDARRRNPDQRSDFADLPPPKPKS